MSEYGETEFLNMQRKILKFLFQPRKHCDNRDIVPIVKWAAFYSFHLEAEKQVNFDFKPNCHADGSSGRTGDPD